MLTDRHRSRFFLRRCEHFGQIVVNWPLADGLALMPFRRNISLTEVIAAGPVRRGLARVHARWRGFCRPDAISMAARACAMLPPLACFSLTIIPPASLPSTSLPRRNRSASGSTKGSEAASFFSSFLSLTLYSVSGGVSETFRVTDDETFPCRSLKRFTREVETSLLN